MVSGDKHNNDRDWPIVAVCPVSSGHKASEHDVRVGAGYGGLSTKGWVRVALVQPFEKDALGDCLSVSGIPPDTLDEVHERLVSYFDPR